MWEKSTNVGLNEVKQTSSLLLSRGVYLGKYPLPQGVSADVTRGNKYAKGEKKKRKRKK